MKNIWGLNSTMAGESRGVSPVIATVLVVAIVVIISASIAAVTLGYTDQLSDPAPTTAFEFDYEDEWKITHTQGESIDADALQIRIDDPDGVADNVTDWPGTETVSAGTSVKVGGSDTTGNEEVSVIWEDGSSSYSIGSTGSSSGSGSSGGSGSGSGEGTVASLGASFEQDATTNDNEITVSVVDGAGNPVEDAEITVSVLGDPIPGRLSAYPTSTGAAYSAYINKETITVRTGSDGEFETAISEDPESLGVIKIVPVESNVNNGDEISVRLESNSNDVEQTITYEYR